MYVVKFYSWYVETLNIKPKWKNRNRSLKFKSFASAPSIYTYSVGTGWVWVKQEGRIEVEDVGPSVPL